MREGIAGRNVDDIALKVLVLRHLRKEYRDAPVTRAPGPISVLGIAGEAGIKLIDVKGMIVELVDRAYARPTSSSAPQLAIEGECEITSAGLAFLESYEATWHEPERLPRNPIGFQIPS